MLLGKGVDDLQALRRWVDSAFHAIRFLSASVHPGLKAVFFDTSSENFPLLQVKPLSLSHDTERSFKEK